MPIPSSVHDPVPRGGDLFGLQGGGSPSKEEALLFQVKYSERFHPGVRDRNVKATARKTLI